MIKCNHQNNKLVLTLKIYNFELCSNQIKSNQDQINSRSNQIKINKDELL